MRPYIRYTPIATVVGCAMPGADLLRWTLTSAVRLPPPAPPAEGAPPARVPHNITKEERETALGLSAGSNTFELVGVSDFVSNEQSLVNPVRKALYPLERVNATGALAPGRRIAAKGVLIPGSPARINLTSVVVLDQSCSAQSTAQAANH